MKKRICAKKRMVRDTCVIVSVLLMGVWAHGQTPPPPAGTPIPVDLYPPHLRPTPTLSPEQQTTIDRALEDLNSDNVEFRAGAVMLLGKYEVAVAQDAVIRALKDPHERVRRAALVSVTEWSRKAPLSAVEPVLSLLTDPDVEIRRMASSSLRLMVNIRQMARMSSFGRQRLQPFSPATEHALVDAFLDEDAIVRRNMLSQYTRTMFTVPPETFLQLLSDPDRQVRMTALPLASSFADTEAFLKAASHLVDDEDKEIRLLLIRQLFKHNHPLSYHLLQALLDDPDTEVAAEAELWLFQMKNDPDLFARIYQRYRRNELTDDQATRMIQLAAVLGEGVKEYIYSLMEADDSVVKAEAIRLFLELPWDTSHEQYLRQFINDPSLNIRQLALEYFQYHQERLTSALLEELVFSRYIDVRRFLIQLADSLPDKERQFVINELILDESPEIRIAAIHKMARNKLAGWDRVLAASLNDPNTEIQKTAVMQLLRSEESVAKTILHKYLTDHPDSPLSDYIRGMLKRQNSFQAL